MMAGRNIGTSKQFIKQFKKQDYLLVWIAVCLLFPPFLIGQFGVTNSRNSQMSSCELIRAVFFTTVAQTLSQNKLLASYYEIEIFLIWI